MLNIVPKIKVYDSEGKLTRAYNNAIKKMIDKIYYVDLEEFDFNEVEKDKSKKLDNLIIKLCDESGLGSKDIYSIILDRFQDEYGVDIDIYNIEESTKSTKKSLKEKAHFMFDVDLVFDILTSVVDYEDWGYEYSEPYVQLKESSLDYEEYILGGCKNLTSYIKDLEKAFNKIWNKGIFTIKPYGYKDEKLILTIDYNI